MCPQVFTSLNGFRRNLDLNIFCESLYVGLCSALLSVSSIAVPARLSRIFILISVYRFVPTVFSRGRGPTVLCRGPTILRRCPTNLRRGPTILRRGPTIICRGPTNLRRGPMDVCQR